MSDDYPSSKGGIYSQVYIYINPTPQTPEECTALDDKIMPEPPNTVSVYEITKSAVT
jgi:hypothetical protein